MATTALERLKSEPPQCAATPKPSWREPVALWAATRLFCGAAINAGAWLWPCPYDYRQDSPAAGSIDDLPAFYAQYAAHPDAFGRRPFVGLRVGGEWRVLAPLFRWDAFWYLSVVEVGYVADPARESQQNVAFFPAYPLAVRAVEAFGVPPLIGALVIANAALLAATCVFHRLVVARYGPTAARWTVALWLLYPTSFFGAVPYAESLAALAGVCWLAAALDRRYAKAGFWTGVASAVRPQGLLLGLANLEALTKHGRRREAAIGLALCGVGLAAYMAYLAWRFDDPLLFVEVQGYWRPEENASWNPLRWLGLILAGLLYPAAVVLRGEPSLLLSSRAVDAYLLVWAAAWLPLVRRRCGWGVALATAAMFVMPLATGGLASFGRFTWLMLPVFLASGVALSQHRARFTIAAASAVLLAWLAALYGGYWMAI